MGTLRAGSHSASLLRIHRHSRDSKRYTSDDGEDVCCMESDYLPLQERKIQTGADWGYMYQKADSHETGG